MSDQGFTIPDDVCLFVNYRCTTHGEDCERLRSALTPTEAIAALDAVDVGNPEAAHSDAEDILLASVPPEVQAAFVRVRERCRWWVYA